MAIEGIPDPQKHRICRRCQQWFDPIEGSLHATEFSGPIGSLHALRGTVTGDPSLLRFQCNRCTRIRRRTKVVLWSVLIALITIVLVLNKLGVLN